MIGLFNLIMFYFVSVDRCHVWKHWAVAVNRLYWHADFDICIYIKWIKRKTCSACTYMHTALKL